MGWSYRIEAPQDAAEQELQPGFAVRTSQLECPDAQPQVESEEHHNMPQKEHVPKRASRICRSNL